MTSVRFAIAEDLGAIARYLAGTLRGEGGAGRYRKFLEYRWMAEKPNLGVVIEDGGAIHGFIGAIYAERTIGDLPQRFCNLTSISVDESHRRFTLQAFNLLFKQKDVTFTSFSASEPVQKILDFFKFEHAASDKVVVAPPAGAGALRHAMSVRAITKPDHLERELEPAQQAIFRDHRMYGCGQLLLVHGEQRCYVVTVRRGHGSRAFADVLHASNPDMFVDHLPWIQASTLRAHGTLLTGIDARWLRSRPRLSYVYRKLRPVYARSPNLSLEKIDSLYTELVPMYGHT